MTVPWHLGPVKARLNPALIIGTDHTLRSGERVRLYQTANLGLFQHYWWMTGVYLDTEAGAAYRLPGGFHADLRLGAGYMHYFWRRQTFELENGVYVPARNWGKPSLRLPLSVLIGYRGYSGRSISVAPFVSAQWAAQVLFLDEIPAMTHFILHTGVRIEWRRTSSRAGG